MTYFLAELIIFTLNSFAVYIMINYYRQCGGKTYDNKTDKQVDESHIEIDHVRSSKEKLKNKLQNNKINNSLEIVNIKIFD